MKKLAFFILAAFLLSPSNGFAKEPLYPGFPETAESKAYKKFSKRPVSDFSKILFLIDRFGEAKIDVVYDGQNYPAPVATTVARWFLARNYKKQTPSQWVEQWCTRSIFTNKHIYVKLPDGKFRNAGEVLHSELAELESLIRGSQTGTHLVADKAVDANSRPVSSRTNLPSHAGQEIAARS